MLTTKRFQIDRLSTPEAIRQISDSLVGIQGVGDIGVNGEEGLLEVAFDPDRTSEAAIQSAITGAGFRMR